jgi:hypothetical protein
MWHIVKKKGIQSLARKPEQEEPRRLGRIMQMSVFGRIGLFFRFFRRLGIS